MIKTGFKSLLFVALAFAVAQGQQKNPANAPEVARTNIIDKVETPTDTDVYCSGFVSPQVIPHSTFVAGGWSTPSVTQYADRDLIYLTGGSFDVGSKFAILHEQKDIHAYEPYPGQKRILRKYGKAYAELGRVRVIKVEKGIGIAEVEFSCDAMNPGDIAQPWMDKPRAKFRRPMPFDKFASPNGMLTGRIIAGKGDDMLSAPKAKVYLNVGSGNGVKIGDYFRATRTYTSLLEDSVDQLEFSANLKDPSTPTQAPVTKAKLGELPRRTLAEMIILSTTPTTSTAMLMSAVEAVQVGDMVEMMEEPPPLPPPPPVVMNPPQITCTASPASVRSGETSTIRCNAMSPDGRPLSYAWRANRGSIVPRENVATLETANLSAGSIMVTTTATDDRNLSASAATAVGITAAPGAAQAARIGQIMFKANSAYVDNRAKAMLDDIALRLQREPNSRVLLIGFSTGKEPSRLSTARAANAKTYLTKDKGIEDGRVMTRNGGVGNSSNVEVWFVPAGAKIP